MLASIRALSAEATALRDAVLDRRITLAKALLREILMTPDYANTFALNSLFPMLGYSHLIEFQL